MAGTIIAAGHRRSASLRLSEARILKQQYLDSRMDGRPLWLDSGELMGPWTRSCMACQVGRLLRRATAGKVSAIATSMSSKHLMALSGQSWKTLRLTLAAGWHMVRISLRSSGMPRRGPQTVPPSHDPQVDEVRPIRRQHHPRAPTQSRSLLRACGHRAPVLGTSTRSRVQAWRRAAGRYGRHGRYSVGAALPFGKGLHLWQAW
mmetsp:Transcript_144515/g.463099  ORF Transcript_144515/g.463099 Transcript_144515/m.463099 type:complete len:204 (-) Transcript_144515:280-891(-)